MAFTSVFGLPLGKFQATVDVKARLRQHFAQNMVWRFPIEIQTHSK